MPAACFLRDQYAQNKVVIPNVTGATENRRRLLERLREPYSGMEQAFHGEISRPEPGSTTSIEEWPKHNANHDDTEASQLTLEESRSNNEAKRQTLFTLPIQLNDNTQTSSSSIRGSTSSSVTVFRWSLLPAPLDLKTSSVSTKLPPPARIYGGASSKVQEHFGANNVDIGYNYFNKPSMASESYLPRKSLQAKYLSPKSSSITACGTPPPVHLPWSSGTTYHGKADTMLGLHRLSKAPPVPPKDVPSYAKSYASDFESLASLPLHKDFAGVTLLQPRNGRTAKLHAWTALLIVFNTWGMCNSFGLFQAYYERDFLPGTNPSSISWIGSIQLALVFGLGVPVGRLIDKGYFRHIFHGGSVLLIVGVFCTSFCTRLWQLLLIQGCLTGLGMGMTTCAGIVALMTWWDEHKISRAMALAAAGSCIGGIIYVLIARHLLETHNFETTMLVIGGVATVTMIPPNLVFRMRDSSAGLKARPRGSSSRPGWHTFAETSYLLAAAGMFFSFLGVYFGFVYMVSFGSTQVHLSDTAATNLLIFMLVANLPGRFLPALLSDRCIGPLNTIIPSALLSSAVIWLWTASGDRKESLIVIACFYGFISAGIQVLYAPTVYTFCLEPAKSNSPTESTQLSMDKMGLRAGGIFTTIGLGCLIGLPIGGALINYRIERNLSDPYLGAQIFAGACLLLGGCLLLCSRVAKAGWAAQRA